jgi:hypothetical protein
MVGVNGLAFTSRPRLVFLGAVWVSGTVFTSLSVFWVEIGDGEGEAVGALTGTKFLHVLVGVGISVVLAVEPEGTVGSTGSSEVALAGNGDSIGLDSRPLGILNK